MIFASEKLLSFSFYSAICCVRLLLARAHLLSGTARFIHSFSQLLRVYRTTILPRTIKLNPFCTEIMSSADVDAFETLHVLVIAHPDDESMFFLPCLHYLKRKHHAAVWLLCLTTGNYDGLGAVRSSELHVATTAVLGLDKLIILDDPTVQDHPSLTWNIESTAAVIQTTLAAALKEGELLGNVTTLNLITFDEFGVSGHVNHRDTYYAVHQLYLKQQQQRHLATNPALARTVTAWSLETVHNPIVKYIPVLEWIRLFLRWCRISSAPSSESDGEHRVLYRMLQPSLNWKAMATHRSQFVWYRRLFVVFSCYTYVNRIRRMDSDLLVLESSHHPVRKEL